MSAGKRKTDIVYFLGAGFSAPFKIPIMKDMVKGFEEEIDVSKMIELRRVRNWKWKEQMRREAREAKMEQLLKRTETLHPSLFKEDKNDLLVNVPISTYGYEKYDPYKEELEKLNKEIEGIRKRYNLPGFHKTWERVTSKSGIEDRERESYDKNIDIEAVIARLDADDQFSQWGDRWMTDIRKGIECIYPTDERKIERYGTSFFIADELCGHMLDTDYSVHRKKRFKFLMKDDTYLSADKVRDFMNEYFAKYRAILFDYIRRVCSPNLEASDVSGSVSGILEPFGTFNVDLFTTNYDFVIEALLQGMDECFERGIELNPKDGNTYWDFSHINKSAERIRLIKLHGSIDLYTLPDGCIIRSPIVTSGGRLQDGTPFEEMLIYPTQQKSVKDPPYRQMFNALSAAISQARVLVFIGFNFNASEEHIREAIENGLARNPSIKIAVVKGNPTPTIKQLRMIEALKGKRIKRIAGRLPKREVITELTGYMKKALKVD